MLNFFISKQGKSKKTPTPHYFLSRKIYEEMAYIHYMHTNITYMHLDVK